MNFFILKFKKLNEINLLTNVVVTEVKQIFIDFYLGVITRVRIGACLERSRKVTSPRSKKVAVGFSLQSLTHLLASLGY